MRFLISGLPMPPSVNDQYMPFGFRAKDGKIRARINPTKYLNKFHDNCEEWEKANNLLIGKARIMAKQALAEGNMLWISFFCVFPSTLIWRPNGLPRKMDVSNRMKPLEDALAKMLLIDDCYFFNTGAEKVERIRIETPFCAALIRPWKPRSVAEVKEQEKL